MAVGARRRSRKASSRRTSRCTAPAARRSTAASSSAGKKGGHGDDRSAPRDRAVVRRLLLHGRQHAGRRQDPQVGDAARPRREDAASICRTKSQGLVPSTEWKTARTTAREVVRRRNHLGRHRAGAGLGDADLDGGLHGDARQRRHAASRRTCSRQSTTAAAGSRSRRRRRSRSRRDPEKLQAIRDGLWMVVNGGGTGGRARIDRPRRLRQDRHRAGHFEPGPRRGARQTARTCATTAGSCSSRRATTRRSPAWCSSSTASTAPNAASVAHHILDDILREAGRAAAAAAADPRRPAARLQGPVRAAAAGPSAPPVGG